MAYTLTQLAALEFAYEVLSHRADELLSLVRQAQDYEAAKTATDRYLRAHGGAMELQSVLIQHQLAQAAKAVP